MSIKKKLIIAGVSLFAFSSLSTSVFAANNYSSRVETLSQLTGQSTDAIQESRNAGKTLGTIANEAGVLAAFQAKNLEAKKEVLNNRVEQGTMSSEARDSALQKIEERQSACDGTGPVDGERLGLGLGNGNGDGTGIGTGSGNQGQGNGTGMGKGAGTGNGGGGQGQGLRDGSCLR